jgi:hypothetical protein
MGAARFMFFVINAGFGHTSQAQCGMISPYLKLTTEN